jgi:hypothetical protein
MREILLGLLGGNGGRAAANGNVVRRALFITGNEIAFFLRTQFGRQRGGSYNTIQQKCSGKSRRWKLTFTYWH